MAEIFDFVPIRLKLSNAYLLIGPDEGPILIDTGSPGEADAIEKAVKAEGFELEDLALIAHTHAHSDHVGSTAELLRRADVPTALHPADRERLASGTNGPLRGIGTRGRTMSFAFSNAKFEPFEPTVDLAEGTLAQWGWGDMEVWETPGHTAGSVTFRRSGLLWCGDVLMGGGLGGKLRPKDVRYHYFADDLEATRASIARLVGLGHGLSVLHPGHGGPLLSDDVSAFAQKEHIKPRKPA